MGTESAFGETKADLVDESCGFKRKKWKIDWRKDVLGLDVWLLVDEKGFAFYINRYLPNFRKPLLLGLVYCKHFREFTYSHDPPEDPDCRGLGVCLGMFRGCMGDHFALKCYTLKWLSWRGWLKQIKLWITRKGPLKRRIVPCDWFDKKGGILGIKIGRQWHLI